MAHLTRAFRPSALRGLAGLTATLMLGACAQTGDLLPSSALTVAEDKSAAGDASAAGLSELQKATAYWGQQYAKDPVKAEPALNYAKNLKALGEKQKALAVLERAFTLHNGNREIAGEYGRLALEVGQVGAAAKLLAFADDPAAPDWHVISARGTVLAKQSQYKAAIPFYERALLLAPNQSSVLNNLAMAHAMNGEPQKAETLLRQAQSQPSTDPEKIRQNLALVLGLQGRYAEAKSVTAALPDANDASQNVDLVRNIVKLPPKTTTVPAFASNAPRQNLTTEVNKAVATAEPPHPDLKPAAADAPDTSSPWQTTVASAAR